MFCRDMTGTHSSELQVKTVHRPNPSTTALNGLVRRQTVVQLSVVLQFGEEIEACFRVVRVLEMQKRQVIV